MSEWKDIKTAPRDGTWILGYNNDASDSQLYGVLRWEEEWVEREEFVRHARDGDVYKIEKKDIGGWQGADCYPTHWMPLPKPPVSEGA